MNIHNLPNNSKIEISTENNTQTIIIPHEKNSMLKYFIGPFMIFWILGWAAGFISVSNEILNGEGNLFLIAWLGAWSIGGIFAFYFLYRIFRKTIPEKLTLKKFELSIDTGIPSLSFTFMNMFNMQEYWRNLFPKRKIYTLNHNEINSIKLRETGMKNRLTIDKDSTRIDIAKSASEIEREWLFKYIQTFYSIEKKSD